jgi:hypothetical protein
LIPYFQDWIDEENERLAALCIIEEEEEFEANRVCVLASLSSPLLSSLPFFSSLIFSSSHLLFSTHYSLLFVFEAL